MEETTDYLESLQKRITAVKLDIQDAFYYLETEQLRYRPQPRSWNIIEVFEHINLTNDFYLKQLREKIEQANTASDKLNRGWFAKWFANGLKPKGQSLGFKMKTFSSIDPLKRQKKGFQLVDHIVFQDLIDSLEQIDQLLEGAKGKKLSALKIQSLSSLLKFRVYDALDIVVSHTERHLIQAKNILKGMS